MVKRQANLTLQHGRKHRDMHLELEQQQASLDMLREKALFSIKSLRSDGQSKKTMENVLRRYQMAMSEGLKNFRSIHREMLELEGRLDREHAWLAFYNSFKSSFKDPEIIVPGNLESGTRICGPANELKIDTSLRNVRITLSPEDQSLQIEELKSAETISAA